MSTETLDTLRDDLSQSEKEILSQHLLCQKVIFSSYTKFFLNFDLRTFFEILVFKRYILDHIKKMHNNFYLFFNQL